MDEAAVRRHAEAHAAAIARGDFAVAAEHVAEELLPELPHVAQLLPQPIRAADVVSVEANADQAVVQIRFAGDEDHVTLQSQWVRRGDRPRMVGVIPI